MSSPDDRRAERDALEHVVGSLNTALAGEFRFETVRWEYGHYLAHRPGQSQIPEAADCDLVIGILGNRLGTPPPESFEPRLDGAPYPSGTAYELITALRAAQGSDHLPLGERRPHVYVFRIQNTPVFGLGELEAMTKAMAEKAEVDSFLARHCEYHSVYPDVASFAASAERLLREWVEKQRLGMRLEARQRRREGSPFRGLTAFDLGDRDIYFGRDRKVQRALRELRHAADQADRLPLLLIVGPSGAGKSSLMRAGLAPLLTDPGAVEGVDLWRKAVMRPGADAVAALAATLHAGMAEGGPGPALPELATGPFTTPELLADFLRSATDPDVIAAPILAALRAAGAASPLSKTLGRPVEARLLLLVDQLDEVFADGVTADQQAVFARVIAALTASRKVWVVATLRADLYGRLLSTSPLLALKDRGGHYDLGPPGEAELTEILQRSAQAAGVIYGEDSETGERLDERLLKEASGDHALPLLQMTLQLLFERRRPAPPHSAADHVFTFEAYQSFNGLAGAIEKEAEARLEEASDRLPAATVATRLPPLIRRLAAPVTLSASGNLETGFTTRSVPIAKAAPDPETRLLVDVLLEARILVASDEGKARAVPTADGKAGQATLRLAHDLVLTGWSRAAAVMKLHARFVRLIDDIEVQRRRWVAADHARERLIPEGRALNEAESLVDQYGTEIDPPIRDYVAVSGRGARWKRRLRQGVITGVTVLAVVATGFGFIARSGYLQSESHLAAARNLADNLIQLIASDLGRRAQLRIETVEATLTEVERMLTTLTGGDIREDVATRLISRSVVPPLEMIGMLPRTEDGAARMKRTRASMLHQFADAYHKASTNSAHSLKAAQEALVIRLDLWGSTRDPQFAAEAAATHELLSDIYRAQGDERAARDRPAAEEAFRLARAQAEAALALRRQLHALTAETAAALDIVRLLTRIGDLAQRQAEGEARIKGLNDEIRTILTNERPRAPDNILLLRELAWSFRKAGEFENRQGPGHGAAAAGAFVQEVCIRRQVVALRPDDPLFRADLGFALHFSARANRVLGHTGIAEVLTREALHERFTLADHDHGNGNYGAAMLDSLLLLGELALDGRQGSLAEQAADFALGWTLPPTTSAARVAALTNAARVLKQRAAVLILELRDMPPPPPFSPTVPSYNALLPTARPAAAECPEPASLAAVQR